MTVSMVNPQTDSRWMNYVLENKSATIFHHPAWLRVLEETYHYGEESVAALEGDAVVGVLPCLEIKSWLTGSRGVCLPFSDYCEPLGTEEAVR